MKETKQEAENLLSLTDASVVKLLAEHEEILRLVEQSFPVKVYARGSSLSIKGDDEALIKKLENLLVQYAELSLSGHKFNSAEIRYGLHSIQNGETVNLRSLYNDIVCISNRGKAIRPYTNGQKGYIQAIRDNDITFGIGPAGTGKTYLAVAQAVAYLKSAKISRIILVRPVVEAGERLGYLPGDMNEKVAPYLRPLYDAFYELLPAERFDRYFEKGVIELAPLAYMRGRTLNDSFIILDEAQNTTPEQMKMFLTRLGFGSKAVITGDVTQVDLPGTKESGLKVVQDILKGVPGVSFIKLNDGDVVRHEIVQRIVRAYEDYDRRRAEKQAER
ncbi:PhoH family protein [Cloacibacillus porcorum]|jgi:phosphate starvation-inducible protein PhoH and related proteins|uniref:PhoH-like protein n=1 Tax=Cloacibacillus porcorum TaxID=1197717 RepID=A0A1B2I496_9BACT|nr:PhoH family protein [Cloacibacillus porcorum]ANZ44808.1 phosphate starvation-inducible protein PhoH [Cloacibacillus porcorum]MCC8185184.1 PhoH family protein [Cloacibacillus porcorum]MCD8233396.1 PhoH family protein [Cloacibacillus porcorum]MCI5865935.1 PhoH family protein [Cloacibacillus porcorum]MDD7648447.1 PhoH family protein [Cloacibacillus porcorum]